jgi:hypothetical protein
VLFFTLNYDTTKKRSDYDEHTGVTSLELLNNAKDSVLLLADAVLAKTASDDADAAYVSSSAGLDVSAVLSDKVAVTAKFVFHNRASPLRVALTVGCFVADVVAKKMVGLVEFCLFLKHTKLVNDFFCAHRSVQQRNNGTIAQMLLYAQLQSTFRLFGYPLAARQSSCRLSSSLCSIVSPAAAVRTTLTATI